MNDHRRCEEEVDHLQVHHKQHHTHHRRTSEQERRYSLENPAHEPQRNRQESRLIQKEYQRQQNRQWQSSGSSHRELRVTKQDVHKKPLLLPTRLTQRHCACEKLTSDEESMLDMNEMRLNEMILQTFEEMENVFSFPLTSQREARAFTKMLRNKGLTPKLIGECIGQREQDLTAWQGGQANQQIGRMMIARINLPLVELLSSDEEDESDAPKELARKNTAKHMEAKTNKDPVHLLTSDKKQQQTTDLTSSWMKQIEAKMPTVQAEPNGVDWGDNDGTEGSDLPQADSAGEMVTEERNRQNHKESPSLGLHRQSVAYEVVQNAQRVNMWKENNTQKEKDPNATSQPNHHSHQDPSKMPPSDSSTEPPSEMPEVMEEPITKAVALENFACMLNEHGTPTDMSANTDASMVSIVTQTIVPQIAGETTIRRHLLLETSEPSARSATTVSQPPAEESDNEYFELPVDENYDSDLDINNGDASTQAVMVHKNIITLKSRMDDSTGYLYVFSDNSGKSDAHKIKIGASRFPEKRLQQASLFNLDIQLVSAISVNRRKSALQDAFKALKQYQLPNSKCWFECPLPKILDIIAEVAAKFPLQSSTFA